jgi:magnesium chelatase subunit D
VSERAGSERQQRRTFPLVAVVGQEEAKLALLLCAVDPSLGGVLLTGDKGSAKTTLARGLAALLPAHARFVELPLGTTEDRLVGSLNLESVLAKGEVEFSPGLLASANGGVLYVDEVNLLPDHLVDLLLDAAATGVNRIEREAISYEHPARFVLVGSMNPEEGQLRPQLLDRFGLCVQVQASMESSARAEAVRRRLEFESDPDAFLAHYEDQSQELAKRLQEAKPAHLPPELVTLAAECCAAEGVASLRADLSLCRAAAALAGLEGRPVVESEDMERVLPLVLRHRHRSQPLDSVGEDRSRHEGERGSDSGRRSSQEEGGGQEGEAPGPTPGGKEAGAQGPAGGGEPARGQENPRASRGSPRAAHGAGGPGKEPGPQRGGGDADDERTGETGALGNGVGPRLGDLNMLSGGADGNLAGGSIDTSLEAGSQRSATGRRPTAISSLAGQAHGKGPFRESLDTASKRGRLGPPRRVESGDGIMSGQLALVETILASASRAGQGGEGSSSQIDGQPLRETPRGRITLAPEDLRVRERFAPPGRLVVVCLDLSGSAGLQERLAATRSWLLSFLLEAYQRRDKVALVSFRAATAEVELAPTSSVEVAAQRLQSLRTGGNTPLALGLERSLELISTVRAQGDPRHAWLVLVSDGRATYPPDPREARSQALAAARKLRAAEVRCVVVDLEEEGGVGFNRTLAAEMGAHWIPGLSAPWEQYPGR